MRQHVSAKSSERHFWGVEGEIHPKHLLKEF
jgi:hypothetical protein